MMFIRKLFHLFSNTFSSKSFLQKRTTFTGKTGKIDFGKEHFIFKVNE